MAASQAHNLQVDVMSEFLSLHRGFEMLSSGSNARWQVEELFQLDWESLGICWCFDVYWRS